MELISILILFLFGTIVGSYVNVVVLRYHVRASFKGRSFCFSCKKTLQWYDLIPIFSYIGLRGHCRYCKSHISSQYALVELGTGMLFVGVYAIGLTSLAMVIPLIAVSLLMGIGVYDIRHKIVPDALVYTFIVLSFIELFIAYDPFVIHMPTFPEFFAGPIFFLPFFLMWFLSKGTWMGLGDGKLVLGMGWFLGMAKGVSAIALAFWIALFVVILFIIVQKIAGTRSALLRHTLSRKTEIPFAPFLIIGYLIVFYFNFNLVVLIF